MTREEFEASLRTRPEPGASGEVVFDFSNIQHPPCHQFRYVTVFEWNDDGLAMDECWQAYLGEVEVDWSD
jgi:hypothetical protein